MALFTEKAWGNVENGLDGCFVYVTADSLVPDDGSLNVYSQVRVDNTVGTSRCALIMDFADGTQTLIEVGPGESQILPLLGDQQTTWRQSRLVRVT